MSRTRHIIIVEPSFIIVEGLSAVFSKFGLKYTISKAATLEELSSLLIIKACDAIVLNPLLLQNNMKGVQALKTRFEDIKWIGLVYAYHDPSVLAMFDTTITISDTPESIDSKTDKILLSEYSADKDLPQDILSEREVDVLKLLASGLANKEIADKLNISINTVITHRKNISQKTGIKSVSGLTIYAVVQKLITLENISG